MAERVLALVSDLLFSSRIEAVAREIGVEVEFVISPQEFSRRVADRQPHLVLVDTQARGIPWMEMIRRAKADPTTNSVPVLAFGKHTEVDLIRNARLAGCDRFVSNNQFFREMPQLIRQLLRRGGE